MIQKFCQPWKFLKTALPQGISPVAKSVYTYILFFGLSRLTFTTFTHLFENVNLYSLYFRFWTTYNWFLTSEINYSRSPIRSRQKAVNCTILLRIIEKIFRIARKIFLFFFVFFRLHIIFLSILPIQQGKKSIFLVFYGKGRHFFFFWYDCITYCVIQ